MPNYNAQAQLQISPSAPLQMPQRCTYHLLKLQLQAMLFTKCYEIWKSCKQFTCWGYASRTSATLAECRQLLNCLVLTDKILLACRSHRPCEVTPILKQIEHTLLLCAMFTTCKPHTCYTSGYLAISTRSACIPGCKLAWSIHCRIMKRSVSRACFTDGGSSGCENIRSRW